MFRTIRAYINALTEKKLKKKIKLVRGGTKNPIPLSSGSAEMQYIEKLTDEIRTTNLKIYSEEMAKVSGKKAAFLAPVALVALTLVSGANDEYVKDITPDAVYEASTLEYDEAGVLKEGTTTYAKTSFSKDYVDDSIVSISSLDNVDLSSNTVIYYGEGSDSIQVRFNINDDHTWEYAYHTNNMFEKSQLERPDEIRVTDEEYISLIREATETFIRSAEISEEEINYVRELVNNNENDILVKIKRFSEVEASTFGVNSIHWFRTLISLVATIIVIVFLIKKFEDLKTCEKLTTSEDRYNDERIRKVSKLSGYGSSRYENILKAAKNYRDTYLEGEKNRLSSIIRTLEENDADENIIENYKKRLAVTIKPAKKKLK